MTPELLSATCFLVGVIAQALTLLLPKISRKDAGGICGILAISAVGGIRALEGGSIPFSIVMTGICFIAFFAAFFRKRILPSINEGVLLVWNCIFLYSWYLWFGGNNLPLAIILPSVAVLIAALVPIVLPKYVKLLAYAWYLFLIVFVGVYDVFVEFGVSQGLSYAQSTLSQSGWGAFLAGLAICYLGIHSVYLFRLAPIPGKNQKWKDRMREWEEETTDMIQRYGDDQLHYIVAVAVLLIVGGGLFVNLHYEWMSHQNMIHIAIVVAPQFLFLKRNQGNTKESVPSV